MKELSELEKELTAIFDAHSIDAKKTNKLRIFAEVDDHILWHNILKEKFDARLLIATGVDERDSFVVHYHYDIKAMPRSLVVSLKKRASRINPTLKSLTPIDNSANFSERETSDYFGIEFEGHIQPEIMFLPDELKGEFPLRKEYKTGGEKCQLLSR
ncbi:MAG: NADH-quinone oxidoreductase subunit C [Methanobacterium sp.]